MRITRPFVLLALAALLAPRIEASRTSAWERNPPAAAVVAKADAASALASLTPAAAADIEAAEPPIFDLGDVVLVDRELVHEDRFDLGPLTLVDLNLLRGPPPSYPETRVGGFELLPPFRVGASPSLSLWGRQACGFSCLEVVSDSRYDPLGLCAFGLPCPDWAQRAIDGVQEGFEAAGRTAAAGVKRWGDELGGVAQHYDAMGQRIAQVAKMAVAGKEEREGFTGAQKNEAVRDYFGAYSELLGIAALATAPVRSATVTSPAAGIAPVVEEEVLSLRVWMESSFEGKEFGRKLNRVRAAIAEGRAGSSIPHGIDDASRRALTRAYRKAVTARINRMYANNPASRGKALARLKASDVDHMLDLQLEGENARPNLKTLHSATNQGLGRQISRQLPPGKKVRITGIEVVNEAPDGP